jgi:hypothetical protein
MKRVIDELKLLQQKGPGPHHLDNAFSGPIYVPFELNFQALII